MTTPQLTRMLEMILSSSEEEEEEAAINSKEGGIYNNVFQHVGPSNSVLKLPLPTPAGSPIKIAIIVNTQSEDFSGEHWVAIGASEYSSKNKKLYFFDSFAGDMPSVVYKSLTAPSFGGNQCTITSVLHTPVQPMSSALCGLYCLTWLDLLINYNTMFPAFCTSNLDINDVLVLLHLRHYLQQL